MSDHRKVSLPETFTLLDLNKNVRVAARLIRLDRETAKHSIDDRWWDIEGIAAQNSQVDRHWEWRGLVSRFQNNPYAKCVAVVLGDGAVEGAMIYRVDGRSILEPEQRAVLVDRLATAPKNRIGFSASPCYRGIGSGLLTYAICQSYFLGFRGRVNLFAAGEERFYLDYGFVRTSIVHDEMPLFELPSSVALEQLKKGGMLS